MMNISFQEKSIWISLIVTLLIFGYYFIQSVIVLKNPLSDSSELIGLFIGTIILTVIIQVVLQIILAITNKKEAVQGKDERDNLIKLKAFRISYFILVIGVWVTGMSMLILASPFIMANVIMFFFILSEVAGFVTQLFYYRRGL